VPMSSSLVRIIRIASQFARHLQRPPVHTASTMACGVCGWAVSGALTVKVAVRCAREIRRLRSRNAGHRARRALQRCQPRPSRRPGGRSVRQGPSHAPAPSAQDCRLAISSTSRQSSPLAAHAFDAGAEQVGQVVPHMPLVVTRVRPPVPAAPSSGTSGRLTADERRRPE